MKYNKNNEMNHGILYKFVETTKIYTFNEIRTRTKISWVDEYSIQYFRRIAVKYFGTLTLHGNLVTN